MRLIAAIAMLLAVSLPAQAHRLDEYLQATRIGVELNRIELTIDLTPGVAILRELLQVIDPGAAARISSVQEERYAHRVLQDLALDVDGKRQSLRLLGATFPTRAEMEAGEGTIHLQAVANIAELKPAHHKLLFRNSHLPKISVYLVNALVPGNKCIQITRQTRDVHQRKYRLNFQVTPH